MAVSAMKIFGNNLRHLRLQAGLTQEGLAEVAGLSYGYLQSLEIGRAWPGKNAVKKLASTLEVPESRLFYDPDIQPRTEVAKIVLDALGLEAPILNEKK